MTNEDLLETRTLLYQLIVFWSMRLNETYVDGESIIGALQSSTNLAMA